MTATPPDRPAAPGGAPAGAEPGSPSDAHAGHPGRRSRSWWRLGTPVAVLLSGALFAVSAVNAHGTDLRPGRYTDLASLVQGDADAYQRLRDQAASLTAQVESLGRSVDDAQVRRRQREVARLRGPAGLEPVSGPGVTVVLSDAPQGKLEEAVASGDTDYQRRLVVHQQDIQAVVNALWAGGATAVTIQGQRIISTTGIKCSGNSVQLQGVPYPAPYTIQAVGDPTALEQSLTYDPAVQAFRDDAAQPSIDVGYEERAEPRVSAPAYDGLLGISAAKPLN